MRLIIQFQLSIWRPNSTVVQGVTRRDKAPHNLRLLKSQLWFILTSCGGWLISSSRHQTNTISKWSPSPPSLLHLIITVGFLLSLLYAVIFFRKKGLISKYKNRHLLLLGIPFLNRSIRFLSMCMICLKLDVKTIINIHSLLSICGNSGICTARFLMLFRWVHHLLMRSFLPYAPKGSLPVVWGHELIMITSKRGAGLKSFFDTLILF